ncbi:MAG TPA: peptide ABC transporter substrate-binding protein [Acidimicrobiia bacterium]|nr:peptide ABC transporter substrate-binding protein [Acidimicrobiia bacterium]
MSIKARRLMAALVIMAVVAAACGPATSSSTTGDGPGPATTAGEGGTTTPDSGDAVIFRSAWHEPTQPLDPRQVTSGSGEIAASLFEGLAVADAEGNVTPHGATEWEVSDDGLVYTFHLNQDVLWSDGTPVTAGDYEFSIKSGLDPALASPTSGNLYAIKNAEAFNSGEITDPDEVGVRVIDDYTLEVTLEAPSPVFLLTVATAAPFWPTPRHVVEQFEEYEWTEAENIVTNGPFTLAEWTHEDSMVLVPNPEYWGPEPEVDEVHIRLLADPTSQGLPAFEANELDYALVPPGDLERVQNGELADLLEFTQVQRFYGVYMDTGHPPFDDVRVRQAFYLAIDREAIANGVLHGLVTPAWWNIPHGVPGHAPDVRLEGTAEDAQQLLADAGYPDGEGFPAQTMIVRTNEVEELQAQAIQAQWSEVLGVEIEMQFLEPQAFREFQNGMRSGNDYDLIHLSATADAPDPSIYHNLVIGTDGEGYFPTRFVDPEYTALIEAGAAEQDPDARLDIYHQAEELLIETHTVIIPVSNENLAYLLRDGWTGLEFPFGLRGPVYDQLTFSG